ncbi:hypothetical protein HOY82DRAFT_596689 [Tuber indicum]|nr:hypothetical protein HOY82DRAFT_596689 [Tuber indicum]
MDRTLLRLEEALGALDLQAHTALQALRSTHLEYGQILSRIELHEPASAKMARLYRLLSAEQLPAAGNRDYQNCLLAIFTLQRALRALVKSFEGTREHALAVARRVRAFEGRIKREVGFVFDEEPLGARLMWVRGLVGDAKVVMEMMVLMEGAVVRRFGRLAMLVMASKALLRDALNVRTDAGTVVHRKDVEEEVRELMGVFKAIFGPEMEEVD